jgi:flagellar biosynthetic protein FlhB
MASSAEKTEKPTKKRLDKSREDGNFPVTTHFIAGVQFLLFAIFLQSFSGSWMRGMRRETTLLLSRAFGPDLTPAGWIDLVHGLLLRCFVPLLGAGLAMAAVSLAAQLALTRMGLSPSKLMPDPGRLNPMSRLKNIASKNLPSFFQALLLLPVCGYAIYALASENAGRLLLLPVTSLDTGVSLALNTLSTLIWRGAELFFLFGCVELVREQRKYSAGLRMTKHEIKEEHKEMNGNPQIKARIIRIRRDQARNRMMHEVPKATAVVVNPTHYAVALRYEPETMAAPVVVAKGKNYLALRIRQIALAHQLPIVENPPLAQGLYKAANVGQEIPPHLYRAVAEVLAYILRLMNQR